MSIELVRQALEVALKGIQPPLPTEWENVKGFVVPAGPYQRAWLLPAEPINIEMNSNYVEHGLFQVSLYYNLGEGPKNAMARAELLRQTFRRGAAFTKDGLSVTVDGTPRIAPAMQDADRYVLHVRVPYSAFIRP